ncbi:MAG: hypothetical protein U1E27_05990, partial [Kiritimatiellia bacterium]|nr:hypothetical protein [Kiritimatiellia bacterium]
RSRQVESAACFESGRVFRAEGTAVVETNRIAIGLMGPAGEPVLRRRAATRPESRLQWIRGILESLFRVEHVGDWKLIAADREPFAKGQSLRIEIGEKHAGWIGLIDPKSVLDLRIHEPLALGEIDVAPLLERADARPVANPPPIYPASARDLAFIVDKTVRHEDILQSAREVAPPELQDIELFDIYEGKGIPPGRKSLAYAFTWRASDRTLTDEEVSKFDALIRDALQRKWQAEIRER